MKLSISCDINRECETLIKKTCLSFNFDRMILKPTFINAKNHFNALNYFCSLMLRF